jgi:hypothetical protein
LWKPWSSLLVCCSRNQLRDAADEATARQGGQPSSGQRQLTPDGAAKGEGDHPLRMSGEAVIVAHNDGETPLAAPEAG